jgi:hypothetical protein
MSPDDKRLYARHPFSVAVYREGRKQMPKCFLVAKTRTGGWQLQRFNYKKVQKIIRKIIALEKNGPSRNCV